jgi:hypothetical protein
MTRRCRASAGAVACCALALSACGDSGPTRPAQRGPSIPTALAKRLAASSELVAARLDGGDSCGAAEQADTLRAEAESAIASGEVPAALRPGLGAAVDRLDAQLVCAPTPPKPQPKPKPKPKPPPGKAPPGEKKGKGGKEGGD